MMHQAPHPPSLGIGVITYNRRDVLAQTLERIHRHTTCPATLVVADDGSDDGTTDRLHDMRITTIEGSNRGIAWNKNRVLFHLHEIRKCDIVILLEDDCYPVEDGWEQPWIDAARRWGHVNLFPAHWTEEHNVSGTGTPEHPFASKVLTGQAEAFTAHALSLVGYLDTRFQGYGFEHAEHTHRFIRAGFGGIQTEDGTPHPYLIRAGMEVTCLDQPPDTVGIARNGRVFEALRHEPIHRWCWRTDEEMAIFLSEIADDLPHRPTAFWHLRTRGGRIVSWDTIHEGTVCIETEDTRHRRLLACVTGRVARLGFRRKPGSPVTWLTLTEAGRLSAIDHIKDAACFDFVSATPNGFGFRKHGFHLCCDLADSGKLTCSRPELSDWEIFRLDTIEWLY